MKKKNGTPTSKRRSNSLNLSRTRRNPNRRKKKNVKSNQNQSKEMAKVALVLKQGRSLVQPSNRKLRSHNVSILVCDNEAKVLESKGCCEKKLNQNKPIMNAWTTDETDSMVSIDKQETKIAETIPSGSTNNYLENESVIIVDDEQVLPKTGEASAETMDHVQPDDVIVIADDTEFEDALCNDSDVIFVGEKHKFHSTLSVDPVKRLKLNQQSTFNNNINKSPTFIWSEATTSTPNNDHINRFIRRHMQKPGNTKHFSQTAAYTNRNKQDLINFNGLRINSENHNRQINGNRNLDFIPLVDQINSQQHKPRVNVWLSQANQPQWMFGNLPLQTNQPQWMLGNLPLQTNQQQIPNQNNYINEFGNNLYNAGTLKKEGLRMIVIDGSNVAMGHSNGKFFSVKGLKICIDYFLKRGHKVKAFVPNFRVKGGQSSDPKLLRQLNESGHLIFTPSRDLSRMRICSYDDRYIVQCAAANEGIIVSSDNFRDLMVENPSLKPTIEQRLLMPTWVDDLIIFPPDPLGKFGPSLDVFLRFPDSHLQNCK